MKIKETRENDTTSCLGFTISKGFLQQVDDDYMLTFLSTGHVKTVLQDFSDSFNLNGRKRRNNIMNVTDVMLSASRLDHVKEPK